jgi:hypothetical protein
VIVDPATARVTVVGPFNADINNMGDLTFDPRGRLFGIGFFPNLFSVDTATGQATQVGKSGIGGFTFGGALAADPSTGVLLSAPTGASDFLYKFSPDTGAANPVAPLTGAPFPLGFMNAMDFDGSETLFALNNAGPMSTATHLVTIDPATGLITDRGLAGASNLDALAFQRTEPIPEPGTLSLFLLGTLCLAGCGWRWRK